MSARSIAEYQSSVTIPDPDLLPANTGQSIGDQLAKAMTGIDSAQIYQNALTKQNREYEQAMIQDERDFQTWYDSTAVQRRVEDIKAAGLNPWLALQSGGIGSNGTSSSSGVGPGSGSSGKAVGKSNKSSASSLAMLLFATAKLVALLI